MLAKLIDLWFLHGGPTVLLKTQPASQGSITHFSSQYFCDFTGIINCELVLYLRTLFFASELYYN